jgi:putative tricarboxylic transport membrane protein
MDDKTKASRAGLVVGLGLIVIACVIAVSTSTMQVPPSYAKVGPQVIPLLAALLIGGLGLLFAWRSIAGAVEALRSESSADTDWRSLAIISIGFAAFIALLELAGFVVSAILLFMATAVGFGSRRWFRDGVVATVLAVAVYLLFSRLLKLPLPTGILVGVI